MKIFGFFVDQSKRLMALGVIVLVLLASTIGVVSGQSGQVFTEKDCPACPELGMKFSSSYSGSSSGTHITGPVPGLREGLRCIYGSPSGYEGCSGATLSMRVYTDAKAGEEGFEFWRNNFGDENALKLPHKMIKQDYSEYDKHFACVKEFGLAYWADGVFLYRTKYVIWIRIELPNENDAVKAFKALEKCAKAVVDKKEGASKKDCEEYCKNTYVRKGAEVSGEGKYPDCTCVVDHKDKLGRLTRTEKISGGKKTTYIFDPETEGLLSVCPNREREKGENCLNCPQDCKCGPNEICDPSSKATNPVTKCSPKVAYIYISSGITPYERIWINDHINDIRDDYQRLGYKVIQVKVYNAKQMLQTLSNPSTKAIAYFGHGVDPIHWFGFSEPRIEGIDAATMKREMYDTLYKKYRDLGIDREEANKKANERSKNANLDYAYIHACHSLDDTSLRDYLLRSGGVYSGKKGGLWGSQKPRDSVKP